ncbi:hypothetical protein EMIT0111MI5_110165 [Burkholderia sp. IT-111MI5]
MVDRQGSADRDSLARPGGLADGNGIDHAHARRDPPQPSIRRLAARASQLRDRVARVLRQARLLARRPITLTRAMASQRNHHPVRDIP